MQYIPKPDLLDPHRPLRDLGPRFTADDRPQEGLLAHALEQSCAYAEELWNELNAVRKYLLDSLPPAPGAPGAGSVEATAEPVTPTTPCDERGWDRWVDVFAGTTAVLCGPLGDSGFGLARAHEEARRRRADVAPPVTAPSERTHRT